MRRDQFLAVLRVLHFGDNDETYIHRLRKVKYVADHLNNIMKDIYVPEDCLSLYESLRGRLIFCQYIKNKRHKYDIKLFELR